jgi:hypothetical protein
MRALQVPDLQSSNQTPANANVFGRVITFNLLNGQVRSTNNTTATSEDLTPIIGPSITSQIEDLIIHARCVDRTIDFRYRFGFLSGWSAEAFETGENVLLNLSNDGDTLYDYSISAAFTDRTKLGRFIRPFLAYKKRATGGTEAVVFARLSLDLFVRTIGT